jgi:glycosyltransferase involved in cell wall biosynthesis
MSKPSPPRDAVSVVIPVHNAADRLEKVVPAWGDALARLGREYEIVVVDDGSTDATRPALERLTAGRVRHLRVLHHDTRRGFGASLRTALDTIANPLLCYVSPDYPYLPADLGKLLARIEVRDEILGKQPDLISGCRTGRPTPVAVRWVGKAWRLLWRVTLGLQIEPLPAWPGLREYLYGSLVGWAFGVPLADVNSGFKLYRTAFLKRFPIQSDGDFVHTELVAKATFLTSIVGEIPLTPASPVERPMPSVWREMWWVFTNPDFGTPQPTPGEPGSTSPPQMPVTDPAALPDARSRDTAPPEPPASPILFVT